MESTVMEERRQGTLDHVLIELGRIAHVCEESKKRIESLNEKVGIQNGRVSKIEIWKSFIQGALAVIIAVLLPVVLIIVSEFIKKQGV